jgi:hypothetical protein
LRHKFPSVFVEAVFCMLGVIDTQEGYDHYLMSMWCPFVQEQSSRYLKHALIIRHTRLLSSTVGVWNMLCEDSHMQSLLGISSSAGWLATPIIMAICYENESVDRVWSRIGKLVDTDDMAFLGDMIDHIEHCVCWLNSDDIRGSKLNLSKLYGAMDVLLKHMMKSNVDIGTRCAHAVDLISQSQSHASSVLPSLLNDVQRH